jgi:two-component system response regulator AtoC
MLAESLIESELFGHEKGAFTGAVATRIGHFERAEGGTLFLDEVGNLSLNVQAKLLRVLQERTMERVGGRETRRLDVRVVSAANVSLLEAVGRGTFRMDLYYRLAEMTISSPPLRERDGDVRRLAVHFVERYASRFGVPVKGISPAAMARLEAHTWPGNVRELEAVIKVAVVLAEDVVLPEHLPQRMAEPARDPSSSPSPPAAVHADAAPSDGPERFRVEVEFGTEGDGMDLKALTSAASEKAERAILEAMVQKGHSQAQLAKLMNVDPKTLRSKLRKYGLDAGGS